MIVWDRAYAKKELQEKSLSQLLSILLTDHRLRDERPRGHKGALKEQTNIIWEIAGRCGSTDELNDDIVLNILLIV